MLSLANVTACDHPILVTEPDKDNQTDTPAEEQVDELADMLGGLGVEAGIKCDVCFTRYVSSRVLSVIGGVGV